MKRARAVLTSAAVASTVFLISAMPAFGNESGTVTAEVTVSSPCITLGKTSISFGTGPFSQPSEIMTQLHNFDLEISSCGAASQRLYGRGTNATASDGSGATWSLIPSGQKDLCGEGPDKYHVVASLLDGASSIGRTGLTTMNQALITNAGPAYQLAGGATVATEHVVFMPCAGSSGVGKTMTFQLTYTATL